MRLLTTFACFLISVRPVLSQDLSSTPSAWIEEYYGQRESEEDEQGEQYENVVELLANAVDLNRSSASDLEALSVLTPQQVAALIEYRQQQGGFESLYELQAVPLLDLETIRRLVPLVTIKSARQLDSAYWHHLGESAKTYLLVRYGRELTQALGYSSSAVAASKFDGTPDKLLIRGRSSRVNDYSVGFTLEKDPGERFHWDSGDRVYGFDYISGHLQLQNKGRLQNLIVGDYKCQFGQGLNLGGVLATGKGSEPILALRKSSLGIMPHTAASESGYLRGLAAVVALATRLSASGHYSRSLLDATVIRDSRGSGHISAFQASGYHRNGNERSTRKQAREQILGGSLRYQNGQLDAGVTVNAITYNYAVSQAPSPYNQFAFTGRRNTNVGAFANYTIASYSLFGEVVHTLGAGTAFIAGSLLSMGRHLDAAFVIRHFDRDFHTFYSNALSEGTNPQNETGLYWGWKYVLNRSWQFSGYVDLFRFPWLRYRNYAPSTGYEWFGRVLFKPSKTVEIFLQARQEVKTRNSKTDAGTYQTTPGHKMNYRFNVQYGLREKLRLKTRLQYSSFRQDGTSTSGFAIIQDIQATVHIFRATLRYALFTTDDYDNRQYTYENDVYLSYSLPAYYGDGVRKMAMVDFKLRSLHIWVRYALTRYRDVETVGTGPNLIPGNKREEIKIQFIYTF